MKIRLFDPSHLESDKKILMTGGHRQNLNLLFSQFSGNVSKLGYDAWFVSHKTQFKNLN